MKKIMNEQAIGTIAGVLTSTSLLPQLLKIIKEKKSENISVFYLLILFAGLAFWIWYGLLRTDWPVIVTNVVAILINISTLVAGLYYKSSSAADHKKF